MCLRLLPWSHRPSGNKYLFMLSQVQNNIQGTQFTPVGKEETSVRGNWIALPLQQALVFLLVERRPLENQKIRQPGFRGNPCIPEKCRISEAVFLFSEHAECLQDEQSVISLTAAAASPLWGSSSCPQRVVTGDGMMGGGPQGGTHDPPLKKPVNWWFYRYLPLHYGGLSNQ